MDSGNGDTGSGVKSTIADVQGKVPLLFPPQGVHQLPLVVRGSLLFRTSSPSPSLC